MATSDDEANHVSSQASNEWIFVKHGVRVRASASEFFTVG